MFRDTGVEPALVEAALGSDDADHDKEDLTTRRWVGELACGLDWRPGAFNFPLPRAEHVNLLEYRALRAAVRRLIRDGVWSARVLVLTDQTSCSEP